MTAPRDLSDLVGTLQPPTADQIDHARRHAAEHARGPADLRLLLDVMGIASHQEDQ